MKQGNKTGITVYYFAGAKNVECRKRMYPQFQHEPSEA